jgi:hypothetical protein
MAERIPEQIIVSEELAQQLNNLNIEIAVYPGDEITPDDPIPGVNEGLLLYRTASGAYVWGPPAE